jgi:hypothetical protein
MKTNILYFTSLFILAATTAFAQNITEKFNVKGNCSKIRELEGTGIN